LGSEEWWRGSVEFSTSNFLSFFSEIIRGVLLKEWGVWLRPLEIWIGVQVIWHGRGLFFRDRLQFEDIYIPILRTYEQYI